jgi:pimeloyl-ACP methyl ester carboxylesterase
LRRQAVRDNAWSIKSSLTDGQTSFTCADASAIKVPVLLVTGERSPRIYGVMHDALASCLKGHKKVVVPNASHAMNLANPQVFNAAVLEFVAKPD